MFGCRQLPRVQLVLSGQTQLVTGPGKPKTYGVCYV